MKTALSEFIVRKKGIYGILHVIILLLSLFLVISISVDTFKGIPFYEQSVYMEVQLWICALFLADFVLEWILATNWKRYVATHFIFLLVAIPYQNIIAYMGWTFSPEITYMLRFIPLVRGGYNGYRGGLADVQSCIGLVRVLSDNAIGYRLLFKSCLLCHGAWNQSFGNRLWRCFVVGVHGCDNGGFQYHSGHCHRAGVVRSVGGIRDDDVSHFHSICNKSGREA